MWQRIKNYFNRPLGVRKKSSPRGVALILVTVSISLIAAIVGSLTSEETVRYKIAIQRRDALKAEALAQSGLNFARLTLVVQGVLQNMLNKMVLPQLEAQGMSLPSFAIWDLIPISGSGLKSLANGEMMDTLGLDVDDTKGTPDEKVERHAENLDFETDFQLPKGGFGAFDGDFDVVIQDEDSKISLADWNDTNDYKKRYAQAQLLYALFQPTAYDEIFEGSLADNETVDRWQLVANIFDYIDANDYLTDPGAAARDWGRQPGGSEKNYFSTMGSQKPKNAYFDSLTELMRVPGMNAAQMQAFGDHLTLYGKGKVNIITASTAVLGAVVRYCTMDLGEYKTLEQAYMDDFFKEWELARQEGKASLTPKGFAEFVKEKFSEVDLKRCEEIMGTEANTFTIKSTASVGDVKRTMTLVARIVGPSEELYYFRNY